MSDEHTKVDDKPPYPTRPKRPAILNRFVKDLTADEIKTIPEAMESYNAEMHAYHTAMKSYNETEAKKVEDFRHRCEAEFDMVEHPKAALLWSKAWERGHSNGLQEVYNAYCDLVEIAR